ncbi:MAG TPA: 3'(2'),5'-bisphosphate nucleotidase CysQ [Steroidobacteraceae bacterium]|jgi:3'(2'), 5'-bisphosphate nucleotidase|nr:3'(2'),5'-bisphosphate nucleotidase CysQ [Steroidobacteraceae bacterium]
MPQPVADDELIEALLAAAVAAGRAALDIYRAGFTVAHKADRSPVTAADHASEKIILEHLARLAPGVPVVAEEAVAAGSIPQVREEFFLVDPLDGTKEFIHRNGEFTVNIALIRGRMPAIGVVYAPVGGALYAGNVAAMRAFRCSHAADAATPGPREPMHVRAVPAAGVTAVVSRSHSTPDTEAYLNQYRISDRISVGSSLKFCLVASGEADLYPRLGPTMEWDTAAGHAVLAAAGGKVLAPGGAPLAYGKPGFRNSFFIASGMLQPVPLAA